jgi:hypothetical protein
MFEGRYLGLVPNMEGGRHAGFELTTTIDREDWASTGTWPSRPVAGSSARTSS